MYCRYCSALNSKEDHRCHKCGRRLHFGDARPAIDAYPTRESTAPDLSHLAEAAQAEAPPPVATEAPIRQPYQTALFQESGRVIPFQAPAETRTKSKRRAGAANSRKASPAPSASEATAMQPDQQKLDLGPLPAMPGESEWRDYAERTRRAPEPRAQRSGEETLESEIYTDAPVAPPADRLLAAAFDTVIMLVAFGIFSCVYVALNLRFGDGVIETGRVAWLPYATIGLAVVVLYRGLCLFGNGDTPGTSWAGLTIVTFDGERPTRRERLHRTVWATFSFVAVGLGLFWAIVDEEKLTWHDLLSKTFPTRRS